MSETGRKPSGGYVALLVAVVVGALAAACDTPVPTEVREAFEEVMAEEETHGADGQTDWVERFLHAKAFGSRPAPLLFVDGVRIRKSEDLPESAQGWLWDPDTGSAFDAANISRIEVLKGPAAATLYGDEAASGVIQIFTEDGGFEAESITVTGTVRMNEDLAPIWTPDGRTVVWSSDRPAISTYNQDLVIQSDTLMVTGLPGKRDWETWFSERVIATAAPDSRPVIYVDGVRVDEGTSGLNALLPDGIDRIEVIKGEDARKKYGEEGANGVILIFTKKGPADTPSIPSPR